MTNSIFLQLPSNTIGDNEKYYRLPNFGGLDIKHNSPVSPMPLPEEDASENMLIKIEGNSRTMSLNWLLTTLVENPFGSSITYANSRWNVSGGTGAAFLKPFEQLQMLTNGAPSGTSDTYGRILIYDDTISNPTNAVIFQVSGTWQDIDFNIDSSATVTIRTNLNFIEGTNITSLSGDQANSPDVTGVTGGVGTITVTFRERSYTSSADRPVTSGAMLRTDLQDGHSFIETIELFFSASATPTTVGAYVKTFTGVKAGTYKPNTLDIALVSNGTRGKWNTNFNAAAVTVS